MYERNVLIFYVAEMGFHKTILRYIVILFKGLLHPKNENVVINHLLHVVPNP